jgi:hypothetical protein
LLYWSVGVYSFMYKPRQRLLANALTPMSLGLQSWVMIRSHIIPRDGLLSWNDAVWHFANAGNRNLFAADPDRYAPKYGGY